VKRARTARARLEQVLRAALAAVHAGDAVVRNVRADGAELVVGGAPLAIGQRVRVLAVGKAAAAMLAAFERVAGDRIEAGLAIAKDGHGEPGLKSRLMFAGHPVPDARSEAAAREVIAFVSAAAPDVATVVLLSGGASSLIACPAPGLSLADVAATTAALLASGAAIDELNTVRKHLSAVSGGRLGRVATSDRIDVLVVSDVPGDSLDVIASGPFVADPTRAADALAVLERRGLGERVPAAVVAHLEARRAAAPARELADAAAALARVRTTLIVSNADALAAAAAEAARRGLHPVIAATSLAGEARDAGERLAALARSLRPAAGDRRAICLIAGGETTVTVRGDGRGGRNQELALAAAITIAGRDDVALLAVGTDGTDGPTPAAGAYVDGGTVARASALGWDAGAALAANDSYAFFAAEGGQVMTGPTATNVMDVVLVSIDPS
jgi:glycerate-2-kinase